MNDDNDESRRMVEQCYRTRKTMVNPIVDWTDDEVWEFLHHYGCESNPLYKCGQSRIGCIGCPMTNVKQRLKHFERYPTYKKAYINAFDKMLNAIREKNIPIKNPYWTDGQGVFDCWMII